LLKRVRDFCQIKNKRSVDSAAASEALEMIDIDHIGLEQADREILKTIIEKFQGGPVGINSIAAASSEEIKTIEDVYEPYLLQIGFLNRTAKGRVATQKAYEHLGLSFPHKQEPLTL